MKKILFCLMIFLCSCTTSINYNDLHHRKNQNQNLLPALNTKVDTSNLRAAFTETDQEKISRDERNIIVDDAINIFEREVENVITAGEGERKGYISFRITYIQIDNSYALRTASVASLYVLNLLGFPYDKFTQTMEVEVEIMDKKRNVVKRYTEIVEASAYRAYYWGYKRKDIGRKISADNVQQALDLISAKINKDAPEIKQKLL